MPIANVRGVAINYEILGSQGPWVALSPGGRRGMEGVQSLGNRLAAAGYHVVLYDRRNCGASDVSVEGEGSEYEVWADDLFELLSRLKAAPAYIGGSSSGCRLSIVFALRHLDAVRGLLLWRVTGGGLAAKRLAEKYYGEFIAAAQKGGMAAVCATEHFRERIVERPANRERLMTMDPKQFVAAMTHWNRYFLEGADQPVIGASEAELRAIRVPATVIPGNDNTHPRAVGENLSRLMPDCELHYIVTKEYDMDVGPRDEWDARENELAALFGAFMQRIERAPRK